jgi:poly(3-hydroxybutyrate) depolymerase
MRRANRSRTRRGLADDVRAATSSGARKAWPRVTIWQGDRDKTVDPGNAEALAVQWSEVHGFAAAPTVDECTSGVRRRAWGRTNRPPSVDLWTIGDMGHRFPVDFQTPAPFGAGPWLTNAVISAPERMAMFWGIARSKSK